MYNLVSAIIILVIVYVLIKIQKQKEQQEKEEKERIKKVSELAAEKAAEKKEKEIESRFIDINKADHELHMLAFIRSSSFKKYISNQKLLYDWPDGLGLFPHIEVDIFLRTNFLIAYENILSVDSYSYIYGEMERSWKLMPAEVFKNNDSCEQREKLFKERTEEYRRIADLYIFQSERWKEIALNTLSTRIVPLLNQRVLLEYYGEEKDPSFTEKVEKIKKDLEYDFSKYLNNLGRNKDIVEGKYL